MTLSGIQDPAEARARYMEGKPHRDFRITRDDVKAIKAKLDSKHWMRHPLPQESLRLWWEDPEEPKVKLLMDLQKPKPGTPEHEDYLREVHNRQWDPDTDSEDDEPTVTIPEPNPDFAAQVLPISPHR